MMYDVLGRKHNNRNNKKNENMQQIKKEHVKPDILHDTTHAEKNECKLPEADW